MDAYGHQKSECSHETVLGDEGVSWWRWMVWQFYVWKHKVNWQKLSSVKIVVNLIGKHRKTGVKPTARMTFQWWVSPLISKGFFCKETRKN